LLAQEAGADGITAHLREDRRHIRDADLEELRREVALPLNMEMAATEEMVTIALRIRPHAACIVPEKREERTTEGGLEVIQNLPWLTTCAGRLKAAGIRVSFFIAPLRTQIDAAKKAGADIVELHTGAYCEKPDAAGLEGLRTAAAHAAKTGLECHAGHGLSFDTVGAVAAIPEIVELNIGHFLIGEAVFMGLKESILHMKRLMQEART
jgi:pyridoxine 5-phosphate synthase